MRRSSRTTLGTYSTVFAGSRKGERGARRKARLVSGKKSSSLRNPSGRGCGPKRDAHVRSSTRCPRRASEAERLWS